MYYVVGYIISQFDFNCQFTGEWSPIYLGDSAQSLTNPPNANFSTPLRTDCQRCNDKTQGVNHCFGKSA